MELRGVLDKKPRELQSDIDRRHADLLAKVNALKNSIDGLRLQNQCKATRSTPIPRNEVMSQPGQGNDSQSSSSARKETETKTIVEEEVVELQFFDRAVNKLHTHDAHYPNCNAHITKVVLRRVKWQTTITTVESGDDLLGCLSCFSIFIHIEGCFDLCWFFHKREQYNASQQKPAGDITDPSSEVTDGKSEPGTFIRGFRSPKKTPSDTAGKPGRYDCQLDELDTGASSSTTKHK